MKPKKPVSLIVSVLLLLIALAHLLRVVFGVTVVAGSVTIPMWISPVAVVVTTVLAVLLWRESRTG